MQIYSKPKHKLGIVVTTFNRLEVLKECINRINKHTKSPYDLLVTDDGSTDGTIEWLEENKINYITGSNGGPPKNRNRGLYYWEKYAEWEVCFIADDDIYVYLDGWEDKWFKSASLNGHIDFLHERDEGRTILAGDGTEENPFLSRHVAGCFSATSRKAFRLVGYNNPEFSCTKDLELWGFEDSEWSYRFAIVLGQGDPEKKIYKCLDHGIFHFRDRPYFYTKEKYDRTNEIFLKELHKSRVEYYKKAWRDNEEEEFRAEFGESLTTPDTKYLIAPYLTRDKKDKWEGRILKKPWQYEVTATFSHLETPELVPIGIELLRLQTLRPYIIIVDTGSSEETITKLESYRAEDVEIHYIRSHAYRHSSEPVGVACDLAFALCLTKHIYMTHVDVFLKDKNYLQFLKERCDENNPAVGFEMSPRDWLTSDWEGMVSHTASMFYMPVMRKIGASWNFQRAHDQYGVPRGEMGWPDTETTFNFVLKENGIKPELLGKEINYEKQESQWWIHCRSYPGSLLYSEAYHSIAQNWIAEEIKKAEERIKEWSR